VQFDHAVFSFSEADALIFSGTCGDGECNDRDVTSGRVSSQDAITA